MLLHSCADTQAPRCHHFDDTLAICTSKLPLRIYTIAYYNNIVSVGAVCVFCESDSILFMYYMPHVPLPTALVLIQLLVLAFLAFALVFLFLAPFAAIKPGVLILASPNITDTISGSVIALINCS
jgi:hypothetical protein